MKAKDFYNAMICKDDVLFGKDIKIKIKDSFKEYDIYSLEAEEDGSLIIVLEEQYSPPSSGTPEEWDAAERPYGS